MWVKSFRLFAENTENVDLSVFHLACRRLLLDNDSGCPPPMFALLRITVVGRGLQGESPTVSGSLQFFLCRGDHDHQ